VPIVVKCIRGGRRETTIAPCFYFSKLLLHFRLRRMHEMQTIVTDVRGARQSVYLSVTRLNSAALCKNG